MGENKKYLKPHGMFGWILGILRIPRNLKIRVLIYMDRFEPTRFVRSLVMYSFSIQVKFAHFPNHDG